MDGSLPWPLPVYPRVGGGTPTAFIDMIRHQGLSPRGRGNLKNTRPNYAYARSIPAWAGEPQLRPAVVGRQPVYPRVSGGTPQTIR